MHTLSGLDALFLYLETPQTPMHIGSFSLYELPADMTGNWHRAIQTHIAQRLHLAPVFTRQLNPMPLDLGHPAWVEVDSVDLDFHIQRVKGRAVSVHKAQEICAKLHSQLMDRSRPLWEFHVFERIKRADGSLCAGVYIKIHHAALDGKGGTVLTNAIMDLSPAPREISSAPKPARHRPALKAGEMLGAVFSSSASQYTKLFKALPQVARALGSALIKRTSAGSDGRSGANSWLPLAPMTPFNVAITEQRSFGTASLPFAECRRMAKAVDGSFNDIVLWICATALREYLAAHGAIPEKSLLAAMPINLREDGNEEFNTQASMTIVQLGTHLADPMARLDTIMRSTRKVKAARTDLKGMIPTDYPSLLAPWVVGGVAKAAFKLYSATGLSHRLPMMANLVISNVPGPKVPLYMAGARMVTFYPLSIVVHGVALNITVQTYAGSVDFGVVADQAALPQAQALTTALTHAFTLGQQCLRAPLATIASSQAQ
jgi:diacylglycerol O-acyltransferase / wax synthase